MEKKGSIGVIMIIILVLFLSSSIFAETIVLKSGKTIEGKIVEKTDKYIKVDFEGVPLTYFIEDIESINGEKIVLPPAEKEIVVNKPQFKEQIQEYAPSDHKEIFEERLSNLLTLSMKPDSTEREAAIAGEKLLQFSKDYPDSRFAKDVKYLIKLILFTGAVNTGNKDLSLKLLKEMEEIVNLYPNSSLDEFTCKKWKEILGDKSSGVVYIPYKYILPYMRGLMGFMFKDYKSSIDNFSFLKDKLDFTKDKVNSLAREIYMQLALSYRILGKTDDLNKIAKEAIERFPNDERLGQFMRKYNYLKE